MQATLQASLSPKLPPIFKKVGASSPAFFVAPASAIAILYAATLGSLLTFTAGHVIAKYFQTMEQEECSSISTAPTAPATHTNDATDKSASDDAESSSARPHSLRLRGPPSHGDSSSDLLHGDGGITPTGTKEAHKVDAAV